ncbi:MAG: ABC transporter substrate-binding protein [Bacteroidia bacterium]|nr:ABC transporter substrate-binding protein [Bacteroidia bacterium]
MKRFFFLLLIISANYISFAQVQGTVKEDPDVENLVTLGNSYLNKGDFLSAAQTFEIGAEKPLCTKTTLCYYMAGYSWYRQDEPDKAKEWFNKLLRNYPLSNYKEDAKYHKALILMKGEDNALRELGLDMMLRVSEMTDNFKLKKDALNAAKQFLFYVYDEKFVNVYYLFVNDKFRPIVMEAICHHLAERKDGDQINKKIDEYLKDGGKPTRYLVALKKQYGGANVAMDDQINIAVFMPFYLNQSDTSIKIPKNSQRALELYQGMKMALDTLSGSYNKKIRLKIFDTRKDSFLVKEQLAQLDEFMPDIIMGDIITRSTIPISRWAENNQVTQFVLLNPSDELIKDRSQVFLTHPSISTHGKKMAEFIFNKKGLKKLVVLYDSGTISSSIFSSFKESYQGLGGEIVEYKVSQVYDVAQKELEKIIKELKYKKFDAVFAPWSREEHAGLTLSLLNLHDIETRVFGSPDWEYFEAIDPDLKTRFNLTFSTFYFEKNDSVAYEDLKNQYIQDYGNYPTKYVVQGFDILNYILKMAKEINPFVPMPEVFRSAPMIKTIHQDVEYDGFQDNQRVTFLRFSDGRYIKVN